MEDTQRSYNHEEEARAMNLSMSNARTVSNWHGEEKIGQKIETYRNCKEPRSIDDEVQS